MATWDDPERHWRREVSEYGPPVRGKSGPYGMRREQRDSLNLWHGIMEREPRKPGLSRKAWLGIAFALYVSFMLGLFAWVLWKVAHPLPHLMP